MSVCPRLAMLALATLASALTACNKAPPLPGAPPQPPKVLVEPKPEPPKEVVPPEPEAPPAPNTVVLRAGHRLRLVDDTVTTTRDAVALEVVPPRGTPRFALEVALIKPDGSVVDTRRIEGSQTTVAPLGMTLDPAEVGLLRFRVTPDGGTPENVAVARLRPPLGIDAILPPTLLAGGPMALRLIAKNLADGALVAGAAVEVTLDGKPLGAATTDEQGTLEATFDVPEDAAGAEAATLAVTARTEGGSVARVTGSVTIKRERRVLLTTDKPLYQPGQTIHVRALAMKRPENVPVVGEEALFEVTDPKGNKVFKQRMSTTPQGVAHATFVLANELILGTYRIRLAVGDSEVERTVNIQRYTLPKFKVSVTPGKAFYRPGDTVEGSVDARYFFGKSVAGKVEVQLEAFDVGWSLAGTAQGDLDADGRYAFSLPLPPTLVGQPLADWKAMVRLTAKVVDGAGQDESASAQVPVAPEPARVEVVVTGQRLVAGIPNEVWVLVTSPDGRPIPGASVMVTYEGKGVATETGSNGAAAVEVVGGSSATVDVRAKLPSGETVTRAATADVISGTAVTVAPARVALSAGETLQAAVFVSGPNPAGRAFVDLVRDGQTLLTRTVPLTGGKGELEIALSPDHVGTLMLHAYVIGADMSTTRDTRAILVTDARELTVTREATPNTTYAPGEVARLKLKVTDPTGAAVPNAALGVSIVDEAVFALAEADAGLLGLFMALEKELLTPKLELHGASVDDLEDLSTRETTVRVLGAAQPVAAPTGAITSTGALLATALREGFLPAITKDARVVHDAWVGLTKATAANFEKLILEKVGHPLLDPWDQPYRLEVDGEGEKVLAFRLRSAGPDGVMDTGDDLVVASADIEAQKRQELEALTQKLENAGRRFELEAMPVDMVEGAAPAWGGAAKDGGVEAPTTATGSSSGAVRVRQYFPETLYVNPLALTGDDGTAELSVTMADSITSWRMSVTASDAKGRLGSGRDAVVVFQDFFVDLDLPESLTRGDVITVPVAVYNYVDGEQTVTLTVDTGDAFERVGAAEPLTLTLAKGAVQGAEFTVRALKVGRHALTVTAQGTQLSDAVRRDVRIKADGVEVVDTESGALDAEKTVPVSFPKDAIPGGNGLFVKVFPGSFSQVVDGLDAILQMPSGCFEQTSSTTFPNVLAIDYLRQQKKTSPEVEAKAMSYINQGWQRLLTFEVDGGGFSWFGDAPANKILTAFGVQEFAAMGKVFETDPAVLERTQAWLIRQQEEDGSWKPDASFLHAENWSDIQKGSLLVTAFIARSLAVTGTDDPGVGKALDWLAAHWQEASDAYSLALIGGAFAAADRPETTAVLTALAAQVVRSEDEKLAHWPAGVRTAVYGQDLTANIETTALATLAFMTAKQQMGLVKPALSWLATQKDPGGTWHATMPTVLSLMALVKAITDSQDVASGTLGVLLDDAVVDTLTITPDNSEVMRLVDLSERATPGKHTVTLRLDGQGAPGWQVVSRHYKPERPGVTEAGEVFTLDVSYDKRTLATDETVTATATVTSRRDARSEMMVLDLAVPPGFDLLREDLDALVQSERIAKYSVAARQIIVYLDHLDAGGTTSLTYRLRARVPLKAQTGDSHAYEYYTPARRGSARPQTLEVAR